MYYRIRIMRAYCLHRIHKPGKQIAGIDASMIKKKEENSSLDIGA